jgi:hypothetical protein
MGATARAQQITLRAEADACGTGFLHVEAEKAGKKSQWSWGGVQYGTPEATVAGILTARGYSDVLHYPYVKFPHGPTREYAPIYEICRVGLLPTFMAILERWFPNKPLAETQNFFGMGNYHASIKKINEHYKIVSPERAADLESALSDLEAAALDYNPGTFRNDFDLYRDTQLKHVSHCRALKSFKNEANYDSGMVVNNFLDRREEQLKKMSPEVFQTFIDALGKKRLRSILLGDLLPSDELRSDFYDDAGQRTRGLYNKIIGWPDLTMMKNGAVRLFEVKADGDSLRQSQRSMLKRLTANLGLDVSIVHLARR